MPVKPTLETVAREAGVSIPTVSQVLRGTGRISEKTRDKVLAAAKKLRYVPNSNAAAMRSGDNREIGFVINQLSNPFNAEVVSGVVDLLEDKGYLVSIVDTRDSGNRQERQLQAFIQHGRGGLLWVPASDTSQETLDLLATHAIPTVTFLRHVSKEFDHVGIRDEEATATATTHLADLGHQHIAYLGGTDMTVVRGKRIAGYSRAMDEHKLGSSVVWDSEDNKSSGLNAMLELLKAHPKTTAVVCNGDMVALGACLALVRSNLTPGREISVIGFDDIQDAAVATPSLTTMAVSPYKLGHRLARTLLDRIEDPGMPPAVMEISAELVIRKTTGVPSKH